MALWTPPREIEYPATVTVVDDGPRGGDVSLTWPAYGVGREATFREGEALSTILLPANEGFEPMQSSTLLTANGDPTDVYGNAFFTSGLAGWTTEGNITSPLLTASTDGLPGSWYRMTVTAPGPRVVLKRALEDVLEFGETVYAEAEIEIRTNVPAGSSLSMWIDPVLNLPPGEPEWPQPLGFQWVLPAHPVLQVYAIRTEPWAVPPGGVAGGTMNVELAATGGTWRVRRFALRRIVT